jgi:hypothetical protein
MVRGLNFQTLHARQSRQREIRALVFFDAASAAESRHRKTFAKSTI